MYGGGMVIRTNKGGCVQWLLYSHSVKGECSCNENGCTDDSPACCANGTCDTDQKATVARVRLIRPEEVDTRYSAQLTAKLHAGANLTSTVLTSGGIGTPVAEI
ncbi:uncharacterized protein BO87DRAFT_99083 [Aspergillus neoniger CBS 115656]|uniref:Uncharacterized protein n=1 Tax=Aspergillus neoniger (strain CBS 115656) TaxID=1448310 RepID=A0A318YEP7_ASPNB|nr:hypothetical protein BO87DRAFT_99083 [Aspergillus neoniger CBS 115656]PYH32826.1 hypothetical protein BO87DRAFT_99083 [Aspergillus neoniger CBS 115656]